MGDGITLLGSEHVPWIDDMDLAFGHEPGTVAARVKPLLAADHLPGRLQRGEHRICPEEVGLRIRRKQAKDPAAERQHEQRPAGRACQLHQGMAGRGQAVEQVRIGVHCSRVYPDGSRTTIVGRPALTLGSGKVTF